MIGYSRGMAGRSPGSTVTMSEVAKRAGVSITTVSHVMNRTRPVAATTTALVLDAATEVGYVPSEVLRTLRSTGLKTIGLAMSAISNQYFGLVVQGVEDALASAGYSPLLADTHDDSVREAQAVAQLLGKHVDGIILAPVGDAQKVLSYIRKQDVPVVIIDRSVTAEVDQVAAESTEPTAQLVDHLAELGHRRIGMIGGRRGLAATRERDEGYRRGLRRNKLTTSRDLNQDGDSTTEGGLTAFDRLMSLNPPPTAIVVANNSMTIGALRAAKQRRIAIPDDLALVAFDDFEWADLFHPALTTIAQPTHTMGAQAADLILSRLTDPTLPVRRVMLRSTFMHRESCGCTGYAGPLTARHGASASVR